MEIINLDMVPGKKSPVCHASQYDDGRVIRFNLYDSGLPFTLDGTETLTFEVRKPDGNIVTSTLTNTSDSYVDVVTTEQMTAVKGANLCEVRVEKGATNIGSLNVIMAVEMDPTDGGIASASEIDNLRSQVSGMVAEEVEEQYDAESVIFDSAPTPGHGNGYAVTSEGIATALGSKADRSELPDMSNYYNKTETDTLLDDKADVSDLPDMSNYYTKNETDTALDNKADSDNVYSKTQVDSLLSGKASKNLIDYYQSKSGSPAVIQGVGGYATVMVIGFAQGVGAIAILIKINNASIASQIDMFTGGAYTGSQVTFSYNYSLSQLSIVTTNASNSTFTVIKGGL